MYFGHPELIIIRNHSVPNNSTKFIKKDKTEDYCDDSSDSEVTTNNTTPKHSSQPSSTLDLESSATSESKRRIQPHRARKQEV